MISKELSATLGLAVKEAKKRRHEYVSTEHILFAILFDHTGIEIIEGCGGVVEELKGLRVQELRLPRPSTMASQ